MDNLDGLGDQYTVDMDSKYPEFSDVMTTDRSLAKYDSNHLGSIYRETFKNKHTPVSADHTTSAGRGTVFGPVHDPNTGELAVVILLFILIIICCFCLKMTSDIQAQFKILKKLIKNSHMQDVRGL